MMQGVMTSGTGRSIWGYGVKGEIAGKTGTTNDNSDGWFMGYTPQLLAGAWVGCDDRFIRFNSTDVGQGSRVAMPIWAYFYEKVSNDPQCGIDSKSTFAKPDAATNDIPSWDTQQPLGAEGDDGNTGKSTDYEIVPTTATPDDFIKPESTIPKQEDKKQPAKPETKSPAVVPEKPKATMPKKGGRK
ncbi:unnamed protein product [Rotaria sordida]|uniref:peptidoglycan glycosyltransferase n=1 Tax=Rotaria sordida TaxID=392033 RepID=A0A813YAC5_9BILA|nr:unnamed protein product [Rotaria sordida]